MLILIASFAEPPRPPQVMAPAKASVRIEHGVTASKREWEQQTPGSRRETIRQDERGNYVLLRIVDYQ